METENTNSEVQKPEEVIVEVQKPLAKVYDMLSEANSILIDKDIYKPEHLEKKLGDLYSSIEEGTGIAHPSRLEAEALRKEVEVTKASLDASKGELDTLTKYKTETDEKLKALETTKTELETQLAKFNDAKFGKFDDKEGTVKVQDHQSVYDSLKRDGKHIEASEYYRTNINPKTRVR